MMTLKSHRLNHQRKTIVLKKQINSSFNFFKSLTKISWFIICHFFLFLFEQSFITSSSLDYLQFLMGRKSPAKTNISLFECLIWDKLSLVSRQLRCVNGSERFIAAASREAERWPSRRAERKHLQRGIGVEWKWLHCTGLFGSTTSASLHMMRSALPSAER